MKKQQSNSLGPLRECSVPNEENAVALYEAQGGKLQRQWKVGLDLLSCNEARQQIRERRFHERHSFEDIFTAVVGGKSKAF